MLYVDCGSVSLFYNKQAVSVKSGQLFIMDKNTNYQINMQSLMSASFMRITFDMERPLEGVMINSAYNVSGSIFRHCRNILHEHERGLQYSVDIIIAELNIILVKLLRQVSQKKI